MICCCVAFLVYGLGCLPRCVQPYVYWEFSGFVSVLRCLVSSLSSQPVVHVQLVEYH